MTDLEIVKKWEDLTTGRGCGCPTCAQNLLDEMGPRFRVLVHAVEVWRAREEIYKKGVFGLSNPGTIVDRKEDIQK